MERRKFVKKVGILGTLSSLATNSNAFNINSGSSQNEKINIGLIGANSMGWSNTRSLLKQEAVNLIGICDVDQNVLDRREAEYKDLRKNKLKRYTDYRELLSDESIDAVVIGTPDHWHCKMMVDAVKAGKDVYVEKPVANSIVEANIMTEAAKKTGRVVQTGQWQRSGDHYQKAREIVQSEVLGQIRLVKVWAYQGWMEPVPVLPDSAVPEGVDYNFWLGMAPKRAFNKNRFHFNFRWFWDYAGGLMTDWGVHEIDIALWIMRATAPKSVMASGGKLAYPDDASETPDTLQTLFEFDDFNMLWEHATGINKGPYGRREGIAFIGNNGTLILNRDGYEVLVEKESTGYSTYGADKMTPIEAFKATGRSALDNHTVNFVEALKANDPTLLNTPISSGSLAAINAQMGNIAYRTNTKVYWDHAKQQFIDNEAANTLLAPEYQNGWKMPSAD